MDLTNLIRAARRAAAKEQAVYQGDEERPLAGYLALMGTYAATVVGIGLTARANRRPLPRLGAFDVLMLACATQQLSRMLTKDPVTSPLRAPFTRYRGTSGPAELEEEVRGTGIRHAVGELVTCPYCAGLWTATALTAAHIFVPKTARLTTAGLSALAGADLLQLCRSRLQ
ncbi:DUF1360 domain-containing protein [Streptomyces hundungensis]|uniref:DUF1360 domain-containing protein n=1 Tax=Streptomyces hundungensis TaxID=1077946 RepID=UPI0033CED03F